MAASYGRFPIKSCATFCAGWPVGYGHHLKGPEKGVVVKESKNTRQIVRGDIRKAGRRMLMAALVAGMLLGGSPALSLAAELDASDPAKEVQQVAVDKAADGRAEAPTGDQGEVAPVPEAAPVASQQDAGSSPIDNKAAPAFEAAAAPEAAPVTNQQDAGALSAENESAPEAQDAAAPDAAVPAEAQPAEEKQENPMTLSKETMDVRTNDLAKKAVTVASVDAEGAEGVVSFEKVSGDGALTIDEATGDVTIKKGAEGGFYTMKVKAVASGNEDFEAAAETITIKVEVGLSQC